MMRDEGRLVAIAAEISEEISAAMWGKSPWESVCKRFTSAFPGAYAALINQNFAKPDVSFQVSDGVEPEHIQAFIDHYAYVNPWANFWMNASNGAILVAERDQPVSLFRDGEFYNDWMRRVGDYDAAVGLRVHLQGTEAIYLPVHYSDRFSDQYDRELEFVMRHVRPVLHDAVRVKQQLRDLGERQNALAALVGRDDRLSFVIDETMRLHEANVSALAAFEHHILLSYRKGRIQFADPRIQERFHAVCRSAAARVRSSPGQFAFQRRGQTWIVSVTPLPDVVVGGLLLSKPQFLVQVDDPHRMVGRPDAEMLAEVYGLTRAEVRLCVPLAQGLTLPQACEENGISYENGRQRLKTIFQKTGTAGQAELRLLFSKFG